MSIYKTGICTKELNIGKWVEGFIDEFCNTVFSLKYWANPKLFNIQTEIVYRSRKNVNLKNCATRLTIIYVSDNYNYI